MEEVQDAQRIEYVFLVSARARHLRVAILPDGTVKVTAPHRMPRTIINTFLAQKRGWIATKVAEVKRRGLLSLPKASKRDYLAQKENVRALVQQKLAQFNAIYTFPVGRISVRNQKTRWGSCSGKGNISFNYRLGYLPDHLQNYIVVHELCHVRQHNHSPGFWALVARTLPNHKVLRRELKRYILV